MLSNKKSGGVDKEKNLFSVRLVSPGLRGYFALSQCQAAAVIRLEHSQIFSNSGGKRFLQLNGVINFTRGLSQYQVKKC